MALVDVDGEGALDLVTVTGEGRAELGTFAASLPLSISPAGVHALTVADLDQDGAPDLIATGCGSARVDVLLRRRARRRGMMPAWTCRASRSWPRARSTASSPARAASP